MVSRFSRTAVAACVISVSLISMAQAKETVTFWGRPDQSSLDIIVDTYNKSQDQVEVQLNIIPSALIMSKLSASIAANSQPDIVAIDVSFFPELSLSGQLVDLTDKVASMEYMNQLAGSLKSIGSYNGHIYGVPFAAESSFLYYNKKLFRQAGLDPNQPPETLQELREYAEKITRLGEGRYGYAIPGTCSGCLAFTFLPYLWANGGDIISADGKRSVVNSEANKRTLRFFHQMFKDGLIDPASKVDSNLNDSFASGKVGMVGSGAFTFKVFKNNYPDVEYGVAYYPGEKKGDWASFAGGDAFALPVGGKHQQEAIDFINWALSKETQIEVMAKNGYVPARLDTSDNIYSQQNPKYLLANKALERGRNLYLVPYNEAISAQNSPFLTLIQQSVFEGNVENALKAADQRITQIIKMSQE